MAIHTSKKAAVSRTKSSQDEAQEHSQMDMFDDYANGISKSSGAPELYLSNSLRELFSLLVRDIDLLRYSRFCEGEEGRKDDETIDPYRYLVLVPSEEKRSWLFHQCALNDVPTIDIDIYTPEMLHGILQKDELPGWRTALVPALKEALTSLSIGDHHSNPPLKNAKALEVEMAIRLFSSGQWREQSIESGSDSPDILWKEFSTAFHDMLWNSPIHAEYRQNVLKTRYRAFFLFGVSSLAQSICDEYVCICSSGLFGAIYAISPCLHFWGDIKSDTEVKRAIDMVKMKKCSNSVLLYYEMLLRDRNELLANLGVLAREFAKEVEEKDLSINPAYRIQKSFIDEPPYSDLVIPEAVLVDAKDFSPPSLLECIQADILLYVPQRSEPRHIADDDTSIRFCAAPTLFQEVERLYSHIALKTRLRSQSDILQTGSILVLVPDLSEYKDAFLHAFHEDQPISIQFWDQKSAAIDIREEASSFLTWVERLFSVLGWSSSSGFQEITRGRHAMRSFISHPLTLKAIGVSSGVVENKFSLSELSEKDFLAFLDRIKPTWRISASHAERDLMAHELSEAKPRDARHFLFLKNAIIDELTGRSNERHMNAQFMDPECINAFIALVSILERLDGIWRPPIGLHEEESISEWIERIQASFEAMFSLEGILSDEDIEIFETTCRLFHALYNRCPAVRMPFSWFCDSFLREMSRCLRSRFPGIWKGHVIVAERRHFDMIPFEGVALLGISQDLFPEKTKSHFFAHIEMCSPNIPKDLSIIDRGLFLDTLLSASSWCYFSSHALSPQDPHGDRSSFSSLIRDLIRYIDTNYCFSDGSLVSSRNIEVVRSYLSSAYEPAKKYLANSQGFSEEIVRDVMQKKSASCSIGDLLDLGRSSFDWFLYNSFRVRGGAIYAIENHTERALSSIVPSQRTRSEYLRLLLEGGRAESVQKKLGHRWPQGTLGYLARVIEDKEYAALIKHIAASEVTDNGDTPGEAVYSSDERSIEPLHVLFFDSEFEEPLTDSARSDWVMLPLLSVTGDRSYLIKGKLKHSCREHMVLFSNKWQQELFQRFPEYVLRTLIFHEYGIGSSSCMVGPSGLVVDLALDPSQCHKTLASWCDFMPVAERMLFPFSYRLVKTLISASNEDDISNVETVMEQIEEECEHLHSWSILRGLATHEYVSHHIGVWKKWASLLYFPFFDSIERRSIQKSSVTNESDDRDPKRIVLERAAVQ